MGAKVLGITAEVGSVVYATVTRMSDGFQMNDADGTFAAAPADVYVPLTENAVYRGLYTREESRQVWTDGAYRILFWIQEGAQPDLYLDGPPIASFEMHVRDDLELNFGVVDDDFDSVLTLSATINSTLNTVNTNVSTILTLIGGATPGQVVDISEILRRVREIQDKLRLLVLSVEKQSKLKV